MGVMPGAHLESAQGTGTEEYPGKGFLRGKAHRLARVRKEGETGVWGGVVGSESGRGPGRRRSLTQVLEGWSRGRRGPRGLPVIP